MQASTLQTSARLVPEKKPASSRIVSVDALRGFDMFWIVGGGSFVQAIAKVWPNPVTAFLDRQLEHCTWAGFHFEDLIFPLFLFLAGVSLVFSVRKIIEKEGRRAALVRIARRTLLLVILGVIYNGGLRHDTWQDVRWSGVLQRIGLAYGCAAVLFCYFRPRVLAGVTVALLLGYWAVLGLAPMRDVHLPTDDARPMPANDDLTQERQEFLKIPATVRGKYEQGYNVAHHLDFVTIPGHMFFDRYEAETLLGNVVSIASCLMGAFAGLLLKSVRWTPWQKLAWLLGSGAAAVAVAFVWSYWLPMIKLISTPSFVLMAAGYSLLLLGLFYWIVEICGWQRWCLPFVWIGANSITIYMLRNLVSFEAVAARLVGGPIAKYLDSLQPGAGHLAIETVGLGLTFLIVWFLYRKQIFLRV